MHTTPVTAYIALGANLGNPVQAVQQAIAQFAHIPHTQLVAASSLYQTAPMGSQGPDYINAVAQLVTHLPAPVLLHELQKQELAAGRQRPYPNAPRTLDLDILLYGNAQIQSAALTVPHPRMWQRAFVLLPLNQIAPHCVPSTVLNGVIQQPVRRLSDPA